MPKRKPKKQVTIVQAENSDNEVASEEKEAAADLISDEPEDVVIRRLNFNIKDTQTPGRYLSKNKIGEPLRVYLRVRPHELGTESCIEVEGQDSVLLRAPQDGIQRGSDWARYQFTQVFDGSSTQQQVYEATTRPILQSCLDGQNGLIFAYGITNSGKTHTIQGTREDSGLLYRAVADLFQMVAEQSDKSDSPLFHIWVSYLEIYNEKMFDLLVDPFSESNSTSSTLPTFSSSSTHQSKSDTLSAAFCAAREAFSSSLRLQVDKHDNVCVVGLKEMQVSSPEEAHVLLRRGQKNRAMAETMTNQQSSRSHCVVSIKLTKRNGDPWSKLSVVDLAGSERVERTLNRGKRLKESVKINSSLMVLGRCLETLRWNQQHSNKNQQRVPFRESLITRLFADSLSGWGHTVMIATANPSPVDYDENSHALRYAAIARQIRTAHKIDNKLRIGNLKDLHAEEEFSDEDMERAPSSEMLPMLDDERDLAARKEIRSQRLGNSVRAGKIALHGVKSASTLDMIKSQDRKQDIVSDDALDELEAQNDQLLDTIYALRQDAVRQTEERGELEARVRREVVESMEADMMRQERHWRDRMNIERLAVEELCEKRMLLWKKEIFARINAAVANEHGVMEDSDDEQLQAQLKSMSPVARRDLLGTLQDETTSSQQGVHELELKKIKSQYEEKLESLRLSGEQALRHAEGLHAADVKRLETMVQVAEAERSKSEIQRAKLAEEMLAIKESADLVKVFAQDSQATIAAKDQTIADLRKKLEKSKGSSKQLKELETKISNAELERRNLSEQLKAELDAKRQMIEQHECILAQKLTHERLLQEMTGKLTVHESTIRQLEVELAHRTKELKEYQTSVAIHESSATKLQQQLDAALAAVKQAADRLDDKCAFYEKETAQLRTKLAEKANVADQWISQGLQKLQSEAALQSKIKELESEIQLLQKELTVKETTINGREAAAEQLSNSERRRAEAAENYVNTLGLQLEQLRTREQSLLGQIHSLESQLQLLQSSHSESTHQQKQYYLGLIKSTEDNHESALAALRMQLELIQMELLKSQATECKLQDENARLASELAASKMSLSDVASDNSSIRSGHGKRKSGSQDIALNTSASAEREAIAERAPLDQPHPEQPAQVNNIDSMTSKKSKIQHPCNSQEQLTADTTPCEISTSRQLSVSQPPPLPPRPSQNNSIPTSVLLRPVRTTRHTRRLSDVISLPEDVAHVAQSVPVSTHSSQPPALPPRQKLTATRNNYATVSSGVFAHFTGMVRSNQMDRSLEDKTEDCSDTISLQPSSPSGSINDSTRYDIPEAAASLTLALNPEVPPVRSLVRTYGTSLKSTTLRSAIPAVTSEVAKKLAALKPQTKELNVNKRSINIQVESDSSKRISKFRVHSIPEEEADPFAPLATNSKPNKDENLDTNASQAQHLDTSSKSLGSRRSHRKASNLSQVGS